MEGKRRHRESERAETVDTAVGMHFFKVLIGDFHSKLYIPPAFARLIKDDKSDGATLNTSISSYQDIEVHKDSYSMFFQNGWCEFAEQHSLQFGEFLMFRYDGGLQFDVKIFNRSGCERSCYIPAQKDDKYSIMCNPKKKASLSDVYMHGSELSRRSKCKEEVAQDSYQSLRERYNSSKHSFVEDGAEVLDMTPCKDHPKSKKNSVTDINGKSTLREAISLVITRPYFVLKMSATSVYRHCAHVPSEFTKEGLLTEKSLLILRDPSCRSWPVSIVRYPDRTVLGKGWSAFVEANHLAVGDTCVFKLVKGTDDVLDVVFLQVQGLLAPPSLPA